MDGVGVVIAVGMTLVVGWFLSSEKVRAQERAVREETRAARDEPFPEQLADGGVP